MMASLMMAIINRKHWECRECIPLLLLMCLALLGHIAFCVVRSLSACSVLYFGSFFHGLFDALDAVTWRQLGTEN